MTDRKRIGGAVAALLCFALLSSALLMSGCSAKKRFSVSYLDCFDTVIEITGYSESYDEFSTVAERVHEMMLGYHRLFDIYKVYGDQINLCYINEMPSDANGVRSLEVPSEIAELLRLGIEVYGRTDGKVNIALGSVLSIWHEHRKAADSDPLGATVPELSELEEASAHTDIGKIKIEGNILSISDPSLRIDVGALGKGFAAEKVIAELKEMGVSGYLLNVGGMACPIGPKPNGDKWTVGIEKPDLSGYLKYEETDSARVVSTGGYLRYYMVDGKKYGHIIDPETLFPPERFLMVSVICEDTALGDALSTALFCLDEREGRELIRDIPDCRVIWVYPDMTVSESD